MPFHKDITINDRHAAHNFEFADETARLATSVVPADIGKIALQLDNKLLYSLVNDSPITWNLLTSDAQTSSDIEFTPDGDIAATDVQAAIVEVRDDTDTKLSGKADTIHAHAASDIVSGVLDDARVQESNVTQHEGVIDHDALKNWLIGQHRIINDSGTSTIELFSASKINALVAALQVAQVREPLRNETGGELPKGTLVAVSGFSVPAGRPLVVIADKDDAPKRPALAVTEAAIPNNTNFDGLVLGLLTGLNTSAFSANDQLALGDDGAVLRPPPDTDPFTGEIQLVGSTVRIDASNGSIYFTLSSGLLPMTAAQFFLTKETGPTGSVSGGEVTRATGLNVDVAAGSGFVNDDTDVFRVTWSAVTNLVLTANDTNFIFVDKDGVVTASVSPPAIGDNILLADAITDGSSIILLANHRVLLRERPAQAHDYAKDVIGNVVVSGLTTIKDAIAFRLQVDAGTFYVRDFKVTVPATDPITFTYWFRDGSGGFTRVAGSTLIDKDNFDDGSGTLAALLTTEFKKDLLFVVFTATGLVEYHVFYGQEKFTSQSEAEAGNIPAADGDVISNGVRSGGVVIEGAAATIASVVDVRPFVGQLAPGTTAVTDHGLLSGLADDDHMQYLLGDGTRAMSGPLDMGTNGITNVGNVDGVDVSAHVGSGGAAHADVIAAGDDGFMTGADKSKLDGITIGADVTGDNPPQAHTIASHSDTGATGAELDTLTSAGNADSLHSHATAGIEDGAITIPKLEKPLLHTATEDEDDAVQLQVDAAGFGGVRALDIDYESGAIGAGDEEEVILVSIDETLSSGGRIVAYEVVTTAEGSAEVDALEANVEVNPIIQLSGTFVNADLLDDNGDDVIVALSAGGAGNIAIFTNDNERLTVGDIAKFSEIEVILDTPASNPGIAPVFEFSTGVGTWSIFTPADGTNQFRVNGAIAWMLADIPGWLVGAGGNFLIRITRTRNTVGTTPIADLIQIAAAVVYKWDKEGRVVISKLELGLGDGDAGNLRLAVVAGKILATDTSDVEGEHISSDSVESLPSLLDGSNADALHVHAHNATTGQGVDDHHAQNHKDRHKSGEADAFASADLLEAVVKRLRTTTGPTDLLVGAWADGDVLQRVGATAVGITPAVVNDTISVYDNAGGQSFTGADVTTNLDTIKLNSDGSKFSLASDEITVVDAGNYLISWQVSAEETDGDVAGFRAQLRLDSGGGFAVIDGTNCFAATGKGGGEDSTASGSIAMAIGAGDKIQLRMRREGAAGTYSTIVDGSRLTIMRLS